MALRCDGKVLDVSEDSGVYNGRSWRTVTASVLSGKADLFSIRLSEEIPRPVEGQLVSYAIQVRQVGEGNRSRIQYTATADLTPAKS